MRTLPITVAAALAAAIPAQNYTVSPGAYVATAGQGGNTIPFWSPTHHYMQLHGDLRGRVLVMQGLSLRRWNSPNPVATAIARTVDLELFVGPCAISVPSTTYASNYTAAPTKVYNRKMTNLPDWVAPQGSPTPWTLVLAFDTPYVHTGISDAAWEALIYSTTSSGSYFADAFSGSNGNIAINAPSGAGCTATGQSQPMQLTHLSTYNLPASTLSMSWTSSLGVAGAPTAILLGLVNPNTPIPGLCTNLYVAPALITMTGTASSAGAFTTPPVPVPWASSLANARVHAQAACPDPGQSGALKVAASQGLETRLPSGPIQVRRIWANDVNATVGSLSESYPYGLIIRITHQ